MSYRGPHLGVFGAEVMRRRARARAIGDLVFLLVLLALGVLIGVVAS